MTLNKKSNLVIIFFILITLSLTGCVYSHNYDMNGNEMNEEEVKDNINNVIKEIVIISNNLKKEVLDKDIEGVNLSDLPNEYPIDLAIKNGDYTDVHGTISNNQIMATFLEHIKNNNSAYVRTVFYTREGDPIISDFTYDGDKFLVQVDNTRDDFGDNVIKTNEYKNLVTYSLDNKLFYTLTDLDSITPDDLTNGCDKVDLKYDIIE